MKKDKAKAAYRQIWIIFLLLLVLTIVEYYVGIITESAPLLAVLALAKAGPVLYYFMHVYRVWREDEH